MSHLFICRCHSEYNQGAKTSSGLTEWRLAQAINEGTAKEIRQTDNLAYRLSGTRNQRIRLINEYNKGADNVYAIEVHCNSSKNSDRSGFFCMVWYQSRIARKMAYHIVYEMANLRPNVLNHGINRASRFFQWVGTPNKYFTMRQGFLRRTKCPAVLIEAGFLTNRNDANWLSDKNNRIELGHAIGKGYLNFLKEE